MLVYHGSNSNFKTLKISAKLVKNDSTLRNEGLGIYFSTNREIAESYGCYLYTLEINDSYLYDFRNKTVCTNFLNNLVKFIYINSSININQYINLLDIRDRMCYGGLCIFELQKEICALLENTEKWYIHTTETKRYGVYSLMRKFVKDNLIIYMFNYNIKDIGVIKKVTPDVVKIVDKVKR
jgi:hypothetical protein